MFISLTRPVVAAPRTGREDDRDARRAKEFTGPIVRFLQAYLADLENVTRVIPRGALYAIAFGLLVLALANTATQQQHRVVFASAPARAGQLVRWRGDAVTGRTGLCVTEPYRARLESDPHAKVILAKC